MTQKQLQLQARELKYLGSLLMSDVKMVCKLDWRLGVASAGMWVLFQTVAVKIELSQLEKNGASSSLTV